MQRDPIQVDAALDEAREHLLDLLRLRHAGRVPQRDDVGAGVRQGMGDLERALHRDVAPQPRIRAFIDWLDVEVRESRTLLVPA